MRAKAFKMALVEFPLASFPSALFLRANLLQYACCICKNVPKNAVQCATGDMMCRSCTDDWKRWSTECPKCKVQLDVLKADHAVDKAVGEEMVVCFTRLDNDGKRVDDENDESGAGADSSSSSSSSSSAAVGMKRNASAAGVGGQGKKAKVDACDWVGPLKHAEQHFKVCPYAGVRCLYEGCGTLVARRDLVEHQRTCEHSTRPCKWAGCGASFAIDALAAHENNCVKREVGCPNNGCKVKRIASDALVAHRRKCQFETVPCPYANAGCTDRMQRKDVDKHKRDAMEQHSELFYSKLCDLQQQFNILREENDSRGEEVLEIKVKHAELTGAEPFVPRDPANTRKLYSEKRVVDGRTFCLEINTESSRAPDHYGVFLELTRGPVPCKVKYTIELVHHDGRAASAKKMNHETTYEAHVGRGYTQFVRKARLADAATSPYVKNGYVTFKCTFEVVE